MWHYALGSYTPIQSIGPVLGIRCSGVKCHHVFLLLISLWSFLSSRQLWLLLGFSWPFFFFWTTYLDFWLNSSGSANAHLPGCFRPWAFPLNIGLNMLLSDCFMPCSDFLLGYSPNEIQALLNDCLCGVWCRELTTCLLYVGPLFVNQVRNDRGLLSLA